MNRERGSWVEGLIAVSLLFFMVYCLWLFGNAYPDAAVASVVEPAGHNVDDLVLRCMDWRLRAFGDEWIKKNLGDKAELLSRPGAAKLLTDEKTRQNMLEEIALSRKLHHIKTLHIFNHVDCGAYGGSKAFSGPLEELKVLGIELGKAVDIIKSDARLVDLTIKVYVMRLDGTVVDISAKSELLRQPDTSKIVSREHALSNAL